MEDKKIIRDCFGLVILFSMIAVVNVKGKYFVIPDQENMLSTQSDLFTICSVFAGFSFSLLGLVMGLFSEKIVEKLRGTTLIQRKCSHIVQSIVYFCASGFISLIFILGVNIYVSNLIDKQELVDNLLYINGVGFLLFGMIYFMAAVRNISMIIGKIYGFNNKAFAEKEKMYQTTKENLTRIRDVQVEED